MVEHDLPQELELPIGYHQLMQGVIYNGLRGEAQYSEFIHDQGYSFGDRQFRLFTFSLLKGKYRIDKENRKIIFREKVSFEIRSPEVHLLRILKENFETKGIRYGNTSFKGVKVLLVDETIEAECLHIKMITPLVGYETGISQNKTYYFSPDEEMFYESVQTNFLRKYYAYTGVKVMEVPELIQIKVTEKDKYVTKYKGIYITGWLGEYILKGRRKYLDFLYQTGMGSKNAQGFGMFEIKGVYSGYEE